MLGRRMWLLLPAAFLALFLLIPLIGVTQQLTPEGLAWLGTPYVRNRITGAVLQAFLSLAMASLLAGPIAWLHHTRRVRGSTWMMALHAAPFVMPVFVVVFGLQATLGAHGWLAAAGGPDLIAWLGPMGAVVLANAFYNYGFAARLAWDVLESRPRRLEEAAAVLGASPRETWRRVTGPLLAPRFASIALLVLLFALGSFGVVLLLGNGEVETLETLLFTNRSGAFPRLDRSAALAVLQLLVNGLLVVLAIRGARRISVPQTRRTTGPASSRRTALLGAAAVVSILPLAAVLVGAFRLRGAWSLAAWQTLLDPTASGHLSGFDLVRAVNWSLAYAGAATALALFLALCLGYGLRRLGRLRGVVEVFAAAPLATSSLTLGYAIAATFSAGVVILGSTWLPTHSPVFVVVAHTLIAFPLAARIVVPALDRIDARLEDAAATLGASPRSQWLRVHLPLLAPALRSAGAMAAAISLGDLGASLLVSPGDALGLTVWISRHGGPGSFDPLARAQSTALAALLMMLTLAVLALAAPRRQRRTT